MKAITSFRGIYSFLSNFYLYTQTAKGITSHTNEHFFQAMKANNVKDMNYVLAASTPDQAKRRGREVELREDWLDIRDKVMLTGLQAKFSKAILANKLTATEDAVLIEGNYWHDNYWGDCFCKHCENIPGTNILGNMIMNIRDRI